MSDTASRALLTGLVVVAVLGALALMLRGWRTKAVRQSDIPAPSDVPLPGTAVAPADEPSGEGSVRLGPLPGRYLASTTSGDWLDRVVVHGLGVRSRAEITVRDDGVLLQRTGARDLFVPRADLRGARLDRAIAGAVYEDGGLVVLTWDLGDRVLDTGFRADRPDEHEQLVAAVTAISTERPTQQGDAA